MTEDQFQRCKQARDLIHGVQLELRSGSDPHPLAQSLFRICADLWVVIFPFRPEAKFDRRSQ